MMAITITPRGPEEATQPIPLEVMAFTTFTGKNVPKISANPHSTSGIFEILLALLESDSN